MTAQEISERGRRALVGNMRQRNAGHMGEQCSAEMNTAPGPGRGVVQLAWFALGECDQLGNGSRLDRGVHQYDQRTGRDQSDGREILARIVADIRIEGWIDGKRAGAAEGQRVAVRRALRRLAG